MSKEKYLLEWREDFDDQWAWFNKLDLEKEIKRIKKLEKEGDGEAYVIRIIEGTDITFRFLKAFNDTDK